MKSHVFLFSMKSLKTCERDKIFLVPQTWNYDYRSNTRPRDLHPEKSPTVLVRPTYLFGIFFLFCVAIQISTSSWCFWGNLERKKFEDSVGLFNGSKLFNMQKKSVLSWIFDFLCLIVFVSCSYLFAFELWILFRESISWKQCIEVFMVETVLLDCLM